MANLFIRACPPPGREVDIEIFGRQVTAMLCQVPEIVARSVMDPVKGLAVKCAYFPTPKMVADAIEEAMGPHRRMAERIRRREEFEQAVGSHPQATQEARERAFSHWEAQRAALAGKEPPEVVRAKADAALREGWRAKKWDTAVNPVKVSDALRKNLEAKVDSNYVPLGSGNGRAGR